MITQDDEEIDTDDENFRNGRGTAVCLSERTGGGVIVQARHSKLLLGEDELQPFWDAIAKLTGVVANPEAVNTR